MSLYRNAKGENIRLCGEHFKQRVDKGEQLQVPLMDDVAMVFILSNRPVPPELATDCLDCGTWGAQLS